MRRKFRLFDMTVADDSVIELYGRKSLSVSGCRGIESYGLDEVKLRLYRGKLRVAGHGLVCDSYTNGAVLISGVIASVEFSED